MKSSKLVTYLSQIGKYELMIQIARQILAQNMNFSPAWLIAILNQKISSDNKINKDKDVLTITQFKLLMKAIGFTCDNQELILVFEYFDKQNKGLINNNDFLEFLLPNIRDGLRKAAIKRTVEDIQFTYEIKLGLRRLFTQILGARTALKIYEGDFNSYNPKLIQPAVTKQNIKRFLNRYFKYPSQTQLTLITVFISQQKTKQISYNQISGLIEESQLELEYLSKNPAVLQQKIQNKLINLKVKEIESARQIDKIVKKHQAQSQRIKTSYQNNTQNLSTIRSIGKQQQKPKQFSNKLQSKQSSESPIKSYKKSDKSDYQKINQPSYIVQQKTSQYFSHPNLRIVKTSSIMQTEQKANDNCHKQINNQRKRASQIANKLLVNQQTVKQSKVSKQIITPFKKLQSAPTIFYPSRKKSAQSDFTQQLNNNLQTQRQNQNHIRQVKQNVRTQAQN